MKKTPDIWLGLLFGLLGGILGNLFVSSMYEKDFYTLIFSLIMLIVITGILLALFWKDLFVSDKKKIVNTDEDFYIRTLDYLDKNPGIILNQLKEGVGLTDEEFQTIVNQHQMYEIPLFANLTKKMAGVDDDDKIILSLEAKFKLLDYKELKFARENASEARKFSRWAIIISLASVIAAIILSFMTQRVEVVSGLEDLARNCLPLFMKCPL